MAEFVWGSLLLSGLHAVFYMIVRGYIVEWLRFRRISKTSIRKHMTTVRSFWWYEELHQTYDLKGIYLANKVYTILYPVTVVTALISFAHKLLVILTAIGFCVSSVFMAGMLLWGALESNLNRYGKRFVLIRRLENRGFTSVFIDFGVTTMILLMAVGYAIMAFAMVCQQ